MGNATVDTVAVPLDDDTYRGMRVVGPLDVERGEEVRFMVEAIAELWVADDIIVDLRESPRIDERALTALAIGAERARELGHRVVVRAVDEMKLLLEKTSSSGLFVVVD